MVGADANEEPSLSEGKQFKGKGSIMGFHVVAVNCLNESMLGPAVFAQGDPRDYGENTAL